MMYKKNKKINFALRQSSKFTFIATAHGDELWAMIDNMEVAVPNCKNCYSARLHTLRQNETFVRGFIE